MRPWNLETSLTITKPPKLSLWYEATHLIHIDFSCFITFTSWGVIAACYTLIRLNWTLFVVRLTMRAIISTIALVRQKSNRISQFTGLWLLMKAISTQELKLFLLDSYFFLIITITILFLVKVRSYYYYTRHMYIVHT